MYRWILDPADRDAVLANAAIRKLGTPDYHVILEIACIRSPEELLAVRRAYQARYKRSLEEDVAYHTNGDIRKACNLPFIFLVTYIARHNHTFSKFSIYGQNYIVTILWYCCSSWLP